MKPLSGERRNGTPSLKPASTSLEAAGAGAATTGVGPTMAGAGITIGAAGGGTSAGTAGGASAAGGAAEVGGCWLLMSVGGNVEFCARAAIGTATTKAVNGSVSSVGSQANRRRGRRGQDWGISILLWRASCPRRVT